jgi:putative membrane protein
VLADDAIVTWPASKRRETDDAIRWACAFCVASKSFLRRERIPSLQLAGVLDEAETAEIERVSTHTHLYCANKMRRAIAGALLERGDERDSASNRRERLHPQHSAAALHSARAYVDELVDQIGALERIKATRLPIAYVAHLRTFLLLFVLGIPFVYAKTWGWGGVPATALVAFALLGIEGAATECENPFSARRTNHLGMDTFCENIIREMEQMLEWWREECERSGSAERRRE